MIVYDHYQQGSEEWHKAHLGIPTASQFSRIVTASTGKPSSSAGDYIAELIAERLTGCSDAMFGSDWMARGTALEARARSSYEFLSDSDVTVPGFCTNDAGTAGCSPDGLVGEDGGVEIKCPMPKHHIANILSGGVPAKYKPQIHGSLYLTGRDWWDFVSYCDGLPTHIHRVERDDYTDKVGAALDSFIQRLAESFAHFTGVSQ